MLNIIAKLRAAPVSSKDLRAQLEEVEGAIPGALAAVRAAEAERTAGLLSLDDKALEAIEGRLAKARRDLDRLAAARGEVERLIVEAGDAAARAELDKDRAAVEAKASKLAARLRPEYEKHGSALVALLGELIEVDCAVRDLNRRLGEAGRHEEVVAPVETRAIDAGGNLPELVSIIGLTALRPLGSCPGWGEARRTIETLGLKP